MKRTQAQRYQRIEEQNLCKLFNSRDAENILTWTVTRGDESTNVEVGKNYTFTHPGLMNPDAAVLDDFWKGTVVQMKQVPSRKDPLILVNWFWSKGDIERSCQGFIIPDDLKRYLDSMSPRELCPGVVADSNVINTTESLSCEVDVEYIYHTHPGITEQGAILEYFMRVSWDDKERNIRGNAFGCGKDGCRATWNPHVEEQRYCDTCRNWYHTFCLESTIFEQIEIAGCGERAIEMEPIPTELMRVAYQPICRGGARHYEGGNIRFVLEIRSIVVSKEKLFEISGGKWTGNDWIKYLNDKFELDDTDDGEEEFQRLYVGDQVVYNCACGGLI